MSIKPRHRIAATFERGFLDHRHEPGRGTYVSVSSLGREYLRKHREQ